MKSAIITVLIAAPLVLAAQFASAAKVGDNAPCVELVNLAPDGTEHEHCIREPNVKGQAKILEFFASSCTDCTGNLPVLIDLANKTGKVATTRLVSVDRNEHMIRDYVKANRDLITVEVALDVNRDATKAYDVKVTPTVFVLDAQNKIIYRHDDVLLDSDVKEIEKLVGL